MVCSSMDSACDQSGNVCGRDRRGHRFGIVVPAGDALDFLGEWMQAEAIQYGATLALFYHGPCDGDFISSCDERDFPVTGVPVRGAPCDAC